MLHWKNRLALIVVGVAVFVSVNGEFVPFGFHW